MATGEAVAELSWLPARAGPSMQGRAETIPAEQHVMLGTKQTNLR